MILSAQPQRKTSSSQTTKATGTKSKETRISGTRRMSSVSQHHTSTTRINGGIPTPLKSTIEITSALRTRSLILNGRESATPEPGAQYWEMVIAMSSSGGTQKETTSFLILTTIPTPLSMAVTHGSASFIPTKPGSCPVLQQLDRHTLPVSETNWLI